jgi:ribosomal protein L11 methyltransferase
MKRSPLWQVSVTTSPEAEEACLELLTGIFGLPASAYHDLESGCCAVTVYSETPWSDWPGWREHLSAGLKRIRACGLATGPARIHAGKLRRENWAESWKRHFKPLEIGRSLLVRPSWSKKRARAGQATIILDPGLSFGTGHHPTTEFCLQQLAAARKPGQQQSLLDIGTGSGILAIAAAKLGYAPVHAFDFDPDAVRIAQANAKRNRVADRVKLFEEDVTRLPRRPKQRYTVVCANLIANLLMAEKARIAARVTEGGRLIIAGILQTEFLQVQKEFEALGLRLIADLTKNEWQSGAFAR